MYYLINNDSDLSFSQQIAIADTTFDLESAMRIVDRRRAATGHSWVVVKIEEVYAPNNAKQEA